MTTFLYILLAMLFVILNGFFVAAEFSIVKIRHTRVQMFEHKGGFKGKILSKIHQTLDAYLSACQLGITLTSLALGWIGEPAFTTFLIPLFTYLDIDSQETIKFFSFLFAFGIISYLHIVVGELMPKSLAIRKTETIALWTAPPLYLFYWIMYPAIWFLNKSANLLLVIFRLDKVNKETLSYTSDEIKLILNMSHRYGEFDESELALLTKSLLFTDLEISDVMRPISEMVALDIETPLEENLKIISKKRYSRYPIYKGNINEIMGVLHIKDLFPISKVGENTKSFAPFIRGILKVNESDYLLDVFHQFRKGKPHFAIAYQEDHAVGFVTLDNILQAIIGEIKDEFNITKEDWILLEDGSFIVKGSAPVFTLETLLGIDLDVEANTVSGLIFDTLQAFPQPGEVIEFEDFTLIVKKIRGPRILQVHVYPKLKK